jgi:AbrB family looped-hinge helix DNA binding protein
MKATVTSKGQVTIPKALRDQFGITSGSKLDFVAGPDGIHVRRVVSRSLGVLGCLSSELAEVEIDQVMDELRGATELPEDGK